MPHYSWHVQPRPESQLSTCLDMAYCERWRWQQPRSGGITQNIDLGYTCFQEKYYKICIATAAVNVNESVCKDSHAEHVQLQVQQFLLPFRPMLKLFCKSKIDTKYLMVKTWTGNFANTIATDIQIFVSTSNFKFACHGHLQQKCL